MILEPSPCFFSDEETEALGDELTTKTLGLGVEEQVPGPTGCSACLFLVLGCVLPGADRELGLDLSRPLWACCPPPGPSVTRQPWEWSPLAGLLPRVKKSLS